MKLTALANNQQLLLKAISGSHAYGLQHKDSDVDIRGVFVMPRPLFYGLSPVEQLSDSTNDIVFYELHKFFSLLIKNNPNMLELLRMPADCIQYCHPLFDKLDPRLFLSRRCKATFAGYATSQIKKARGLNKKIINPIKKERKTVLDFCYVAEGGGSIPLKHFLAERKVLQENCGLVNVPNMQGVFALYHSEKHPYSGIVRGERANDIALSSIPKGERPIGIMFYNANGYSVYCKEYRQYWEWVKKRNESRYQNTLSHGKRYDAKNMMHTFRLLHMAEEIASTGDFSVRRTKDRDFLWEVRQGIFDYNELVDRATEKMQEIEWLFDRSDLPEAPDEAVLENLLVELRLSFYKTSIS
ncbi:MAG: nucleotidyltransferase domain-containing protein [Saprospiraceae bacterium]|nr:nucleotidyltransferase domain-containing protein [Saprospiraceae bacterium]